MNFKLISLGLLVILLISAIAFFIFSPFLNIAVKQNSYDDLYRKALNDVVNLTAMEKISGLPKETTDDGASQVFDIISGNLSVKSYLKTDIMGFNSHETIDVNKSETKDTDTTSSRYKNWIILNDDTSYLVVKTLNNEECIPKQDIVKVQTDIKNNFTVDKNAKMISNDPMGIRACYIVYVDVDGLSKGPNAVFSNSVSSKKIFSNELYDQFPIYVGINGSTAGNVKTTITGRIAAK